MAELAKIVEDLSKLTVLEAAELSKLLEENGASRPRHRLRLPLLPALRRRPPQRSRRSSLSF